ncbi:MAG: hypothetical protein PVJ57_18470 [Phycisphaerae bacterium]|jgi:hypothetical protein
MKPAVIALLVVMSNHGHWFGGRPGSIAVEWAVQQENLPPAVLSWQLSLSGIQLASGELSLPTGGSPGELTITPPEARTRSELRWSYELRRQDNGQLLDRGERTIHTYPTDLLAGVGERVGARRLLVCADEGLADLLTANGIPHTLASDSGQLRLAKADVILLGADALIGAFDEEPLLHQASAGASVLACAQTRMARLAGYPVARRPRTGRLLAHGEHLLLSDLQPQDVASLYEPPGPALSAVQLPADEPALEIVYWSREVGGRDPVPIDALLVSKQLGAGRLVLCQLPFGAWADDPRAQLFLRNALDYLLTRPEPTPPPSRRSATPASQPASMPVINIPPGGGS